MKYKIVDLDDTYNLKNFKCENTSINNYLYHDSYYSARRFQEEVAHNY